MIISHKYKFIFIKNRKVAGTSTEIYLNKYKGKADVFTPLGRDAGVGGHVPQNYGGLFNPFKGIKARSILQRRVLKNFYEGKKFWNHIPAKLIKARIGDKIWDNYYKFCIERNPWDKTISEYYFKRGLRDIGSIDDFFARGRFPKDLSRYSIKGKIAVDKILRYENLLDELSEVFGELGIPWEGSLGVRAKGGFRKDRRPYTEVLSEEQIEIIAKEFADEIRIMKY